MLPVGFPNANLVRAFFTGGVDRADRRRRASLLRHDAHCGPRATRVVHQGRVTVAAR